MNITIAGGTGFLGQVLEQYFEQKGHVIHILTRTPKSPNHIHWNGKDLGNWTKILDTTDVLINLTGKSVDCRYTQKNKDLILNSRIDATHALGLAINLCDNPPKLWMNSSTGTIYEHSLEIGMTEARGRIGNDFSMNVAKSWEQAFQSITTPKTRKICLRTAIVLGKKGGALIPLKMLSKYGLGGYQGEGKQQISWIHELDFARALDFLINSELQGVFNLATPSPSANKQFMKQLRQCLGVPIGIHQPRWLIHLGALLINTSPELVLKSRYVVPERLLNEGFTFKYEELGLALDQLLRT